MHIVRKEAPKSFLFFFLVVLLFLFLFGVWCVLQGQRAEGSGQQAAGSSRDNADDAHLAHLAHLLADLVHGHAQVLLNGALGVVAVADLLADLHTEHAVRVVLLARAPHLHSGRAAPEGRHDLAVAHLLHQLCRVLGDGEAHAGRDVLVGAVILCRRGDWCALRLYRTLGLCHREVLSGSCRRH